MTISPPKVHVLALAGIVAAAAAARVWMFSGAQFAMASDESRFLEAAQNLANGHFPSGPAEWFGTRIAFLWPIAFFFKIFGAGDISAALWPFLASLGSVVVAYLIGRDLASQRVGLIAAGLMAFAPLEVQFATIARPDAIMPAFLGFAVWCAIRAGRGHGWKWAYLAGLFLGLGWSTRESALILAPVLIVAAWPVLRSAILPGIAGALTVPAIASVVFLVGAGDPLQPLIGAGTEGVFRNPLAVLSYEDSYLRRLVNEAFTRDTYLFLLLPILGLTAALIAYRRRGRNAWLPAVWLGWAAFYLEFGTLVNLAKPTRYLTLCAIPCALLIALAIDGRFAFVLPVVMVPIMVAALWRFYANDQRVRGDEVFLVADVADALKGLPPGPVISENFTWWRKLSTYTARDRIPIPKVVDPEFVSAAEAAQQRVLHPIPTVEELRASYLVTGPLHPTPGWPTNWAAVQAAIALAIPPGQRVKVATVGDATIWRWRP